MGRVGLVALCLTACLREAPAPDLYVDGIAVAFQGERPPFDVVAEMPHVVREAEAWFGGTVPGDTEVVFVDAETVECEPYAAAGGCFWREERVVWVPWRLPGGTARCLGGTTLFHELGHAMGLRGHDDPRWHPDIVTFLDLAGRVSSCGRFTL